MSEITIKTGSDGTDADIGVQICDGAGEASRNDLTCLGQLFKNIRYSKLRFVLPNQHLG